MKTLSLISLILMTVAQHAVADLSIAWTVTMSVLVDYSETDANPKPAKAASSRVDYREVLQPDEFDRYVRLRELRKQLAEDEAIPPYAIFTNEQLAELAKIDSPSKEKMSQIPGVGKARMTKYSDRFLERLQSDLPDAPAHEADR
jgi:superfamily II DNA helicase RecQ